MSIMINLAAIKSVPLQSDENTAQNCEVAGVRRAIYFLLSQVYQSEPWPELLCALRREETGGLFKEFGINPLRNIAPGSEDKEAELLSIEYARLFLGPGGHVSPHESVHKVPENATLNGKETAQVRAFIETAGFDCSATFKGLPDHIGVELEFMGHLAASEIEAWEAGDVKAAHNALEWQCRFVNNHLGTWVKHFADAVIEQHPHSYYGAFAVLLLKFIGVDTGFLDRTIKSFD